MTDNRYLKRRYEVIDARKSRLAKLDNAAKAAAKDRESTKLHTDQKVANAKTVKPPSRASTAVALGCGGRYSRPTPRSPTP